VARPRGFDLDEASEHILGAFWLRGYAGTSLAHLCDATGLLPGSLYAAFGGKEEMFRLAAGRYVERVRAAVATEASGIEGIRRILDAVVRITAGDPDRRGCLLLNAVPEAGALSRETRREVQRGLRAMEAILGARLREAAGAGADEAALAPLGALLFAAAVAIRVLGRAGLERRLLQNVADGAVAAVRDGLHRTRAHPENEPWNAGSCHAKSGPPRARRSSRKRRP
jgi:TetR/AcrR family transcriptional repressor of nem operon